MPLCQLNECCLFVFLFTLQIKDAVFVSVLTVQWYNIYVKLCRAFDVSTAVKIWIVDFWVVISCRILGCYHSFGVTYIRAIWRHWVPPRRWLLGTSHPALQRRWQTSDVLIVWDTRCLETLWSDPECCAEKLWHQRETKFLILKEATYCGKPT
jgi:hypothetical protein